MDMDTLLYLTRRTSKDLLDSTGNSAQSSVITLWSPGGRDSQGAWDGHAHTAAFNTENQQGPAGQHRGLCSILCNNLMVPKGKDREGIVRESGMDMDTLLDLTWRTNRDLLDSTGDSAQSSVITSWFKWQPTPVFLPGGFHGLYSPWGRKELDTTERLSLSLQLKSLQMK